MMTIRRSALVLLVLIAGCQTELVAPAGRELPLEAAEVVVDLAVTEGVGEVGPPVPDVRGRDACGAARADGAEVEVAGCPPDGVDARGPVVDVDADGVQAAADCDDLDPTVSPLQDEIWCNGRDENCNGVDDCDRDGDGYRDVDDPDPDVPEVEPMGPPDPPRWP